MTSDIGVGFIVGLIAGMVVVYWILKGSLRQEEYNRKSLAGTYAEQLVPLLKDIKHHPKDMHFLGKPVDYIVFDRDLEDDVTQIVFLEVKTGNAVLSQREYSLKQAVLAKRVVWEEIRL